MPHREQNRVIVRISKLTVCPKYQIIATFDDGKMVLYDVEEDMDSIPSYEPLRNVRGLFQQARLDESRTCVCWSDQIDLPSDTIYEYGTELVPARQ